MERPLDKTSYMQAGFSLAELVIATSLLGLLAGGVLAGVVFFQRQVVVSGKTNRATFLAREGLDAARSIRDGSFTGLTAGTHGIALNAGVFQLSGSQDQVNGFTRKILISDLSENVKNIESVVTWDERGKDKSVSLSSILTNWQRQVLVLNWTDPNSLASSLNLSGTQDGYKVAVFGKYAYVVRSSGTANFVVVDISNPESPSVVSSLALPGTVTDVKVGGNYAYVTSTANSSEVIVVSIASPSAPTIASQLNLPGNSDALALSIAGNYAYVGRVSGSGPDFASVDISNPLLPNLLSSINVGATLYDVVASGNYVYAAAAAGTGELRVIDVANPAGVSEVARLDLPGSFNAISIAKAGNTVAVGKANGEMNLVSVSIPLAPSLASSVSGLVAVNDIVVGYQNYLFLATSLSSREVSIYNISNPNAPALVGGYNSLDVLFGVAYDSIRGVAVGVGSSDTQEVILVKP